MLAFDIESYPNFYSITFRDIDKPDQKKVFCCLNDKDLIKTKTQLAEFLAGRPTLVGFNNISFDNYLLNCILRGGNCSAVNNLAKRIIISRETFRNDDAPIKYNSIDLMRILGSDNVSLKRAGISLCWSNVQELPFTPDSVIQSDQVDEILEYNDNDVLQTIELYNKLLPQIEFRKAFGKLYKIDMLSASDSAIANMMLTKLYPERTGISIAQLREMRTHRSEVKLVECISPLIEFKSPELKTLLAKLKSQVIIIKDEEVGENGSTLNHSSTGIKEVVTIGPKTFDLGVGGLHSRDDAGIFHSTRTSKIIDADVSSYYPNIILKCGIGPEHLGVGFSELFSELTKERLEAKAKKDKAKADGLKITINSIFGKLGHAHFWLYDPKAFYSVTINGQLFLLMLIESLYRAGIQVLSANTDGVTCHVSDELTYQRICEAWMANTEFELEFVEYDRYVRRDVNNYIARPVDRTIKIKEKGVFETSIDLKKAYQMPIIAKSLRAYFLDDVSVDQTLKNGTIYDFLTSERTSKKFDLWLEYKDGRREKVPYINRFYVSLKGGELVKREGTDRRISLCAGRLVQVLNKVESTDQKDYDIDYGYYRREIEKIINTIQPKSTQLSLF